MGGTGKQRMDIRIFGHVTLEEFLLEEKEPFDVLLVTNSDLGLLSFVPERAREYLHLQFEDLTIPMGGYRLPKKADVARALDWSRGRDRIAIACHAGISRSSALAYVIACSRVPPFDALRVLSRELHSPNSLIVNFGAELLDNRDVKDTYECWMNGDFDI